MCLFLNFTRIYIEHIAYCHCAKDQIENRTPKVLISRFKFILYNYFDSCLIFKTPITQKSVLFCFGLSTGGNDNSKSRYGNDLKFVMAFLDRELYTVANGFSFN